MEKISPFFVTFYSQQTSFGMEDWTYEIIAITIIVISTIIARKKVYKKTK